MTDLNPKTKPRVSVSNLTFPLLPFPERIQREPLPDGEAPPGAQPGAEPERVPDQDLVPEQAGQDQEDLVGEEPPCAAADGPGSVQPLDGAADPRGRGAAGYAGRGGSGCRVPDGVFRLIFEGGREDGYLGSCVGVLLQCVTLENEMRKNRMKYL